MKVMWLGQSCFLFSFRKTRLLIDPFLSDIVEQKQGIKRLMSPPLSIQELKPDYIFITHDHVDHFDPIALPEIHHTFPKAVIAGPESVMKHAADLSFDPSKLAAIPRGSSKNFPGFRIAATTAYHSDPFAVGCIIQTGIKTIYITGDTIYTQSLATEMKSLLHVPPDVIFIVINGKLGNMNLEEAITLVDILKPALAIPMHYGMFAENTADPKEFVDGCKKKGIKALELKPGKEISV
jgi:L-ascorbate metabolism protein UlaG (beta-lactamase superfamily)